MKRVLTYFLLIIITLSLTGCGLKSHSKNSEYYCQEGDLRGNNCAIAVSEPSTLVCEQGYRLVDGTCLKNELIPAKPALACEEGYKLNKQNQCLSTKSYSKKVTKECLLPSDVETKTIKALENGSIITTNNEAYVKDGSCYATIWQNYNETLDAYSLKVTSKIDFKKTYTCPEDTIEYKGKCYKESEPKDVFVCEKGVLLDNECIVTYKKNSEITCSGTNFIYNEDTEQCERVNLIQALQK